MRRGFALCTILMLADVNAFLRLFFRNICESVVDLIFTAKPEQENLGELKQELDVDFHKVLEHHKF